MASLSLRALTKRFRGSTAIQSVSLEVSSGEFFAILGPSGCGKTTLLRMVAGFEHPEEGSIAIDGVDITALPPQERRIGMVFQSYALFPHMSVFDNVAFGLRAQKVPGPAVQVRVEEALDSVRMSADARRGVTTLSGGEQQRVAVARALVLRPRLLLFDEPLSNLDVALRASTREEIRSLQRRSGVTTVYVTHDQSEAMSLADRMAVMRNGGIEQSGPPADLYDSPATPFVAGFLGGANLIAGEIRASRRVFNAGEWIVNIPDGFGPLTDCPGTLAVKPEGILLVPVDGSESFPVRVNEREYLGFLTSFRITSRGHEFSVLTVSSPTTAQLAVGSAIGARLDWSRCSLYPGARL